MSRFKLLFAIMCVCVMSTAAWAAGTEGLLAEWNFDEGKGNVARDSSGNGHDAKVYGATWVKQRDGFAINMDSAGAYVDCATSEALGVTGPVAIEAWIKPMRKPQGEPHLLGEGMRSYGMYYYNTEICWYIGHGPVSNWLSGTPKIGEWNHVVATFDGKRMSLWINGREAASRESVVESYETGGRFSMGTKGSSDLLRFNGMLDNVRVYNRALSGEEVVAHIKEEGAAYGLGIRATGDTASEESTRFFETHPNAIDLEERDDSILFANRQVGLEFQRSARGFQLTRLYGIAEDQDFLTGGVVFGDLFEIIMTLDPKHVRKDERWKTKMSLMGIIDEMAGDAFPIGPQAGKSASSRQEKSDTTSTLHLEWKGIDVRENKGVVDVEVTVTLRAGDPLSYWRINIRNRGSRYGIERVRFPILRLAPIGKPEDNMFLYPRGRGCLVENPFSQPTGFRRNYNTQGAFYPVNFNMQFQALYNRKSGKGIYLGTRDSAPNFMNIQIANTSSEIGWRPGHFPPNITFAQEDFSLPYDCVAGPFQGDWFDACRIYREWALQQSWCRKGPLLTRDEVPKWYKEAPLFFYTALNDSFEGTDSLEKNMPIAAAHFREFLDWTGMRLPADWRGWKDYQPDRSTYNVPFHPYRPIGKGRWAATGPTNAHDGNYPKIGALSNFSAECKRLRQDGGMVIPYMALEIFDQGATENSPYAAEAKPNITRDLYGAMRVWGVEMSWQPCGWTQWWRDRMRESCVLMLERENVGGFYLDVMQGTSLPCYWTPHGHSAAGGTSMTEAMHGLTEYIFDAVKATDPEAIITGENATEHMIDVIDGILIGTLSRENTAPIFAAVYQDYISRYGGEMSVGRGDAFFIECASLFTEGMQIGRLRLRPRSGTLSFQKPEHKEMLDFLGRVVGYYRQEATRNFLAYGQIMRPLEFREPSPMPMLPYGRRHGTTGQVTPTGGGFPALMSGVFRSEDGELGIFVVNAGRKDVKFHAELDPARYGMPAGTIVDVDTFAPDGGSQQVLSKAKGIVPLKGSLPGHDVTMFRLRPATR